MLKLLFTVIMLISTYCILAQGISVNEDESTADGSAMLDIKSSTKGFLQARMTEAQRDAISSPVAGLQVFNTTTNKLNYFNGSIWMNFDETAAETLAIGDYFQGGVVFYLDGGGGGMICSVTDQSVLAAWGCNGVTISGADGTAIGTGEQNTVDIEAGCATAGIAADICANLFLNGYADWFLPSKDELYEMYDNRVAINARALAYGGSTFSAISYWSSSETNNILALIQNLSTGYSDNGAKSAVLTVRAVRAF